MATSKNPPLFDQYELAAQAKIDNFTEITLRDLFAAAALQGVLAFSSQYTLGRPNQEESAKLAYDYADAMLAEKEKRDAD